MIIKQNQIIEYKINNQITKIFRVLDIDPSGTDVVVFDVRNKIAQPEFLRYEDICTDIEQKIASFAGKDIYAAPVFNEDDLEAENYSSLKKKRDHARAIIEPMVTGENRFKILFEKSRSELVFCHSDIDG